MVWAELWSWESSLCSRTFSGSVTFSFSWLSLSWRGSALLSACLALLPLLAGACQDCTMLFHAAGSRVWGQAGGLDCSLVSSALESAPRLHSLSSVRLP